jgi:peptidyl-prolyl cis-trans isomerase D
MGVMTYMRNRMHIILGILILAFLATILFSWGMGYSGAESEQHLIAKINGQQITYDQFISTYNQESQAYREQSGQELTEATRQRIRDQVWENMVNEILVQQAINKMKITVQDEELFHFLETNPPEFLQTQEVFQTDGQFDYQKYLDALHNPQGDEWLQVEQIYSDVLRRQKLQNQIISSAVVSPDEVQEAFSDENVKYEIEALSIPINPPGRKPIEINDAAITRYYQENKEDRYAVPEKRTLQYIYWMKQPSREDTVLVLNELEEIAFRLEEGELFEDLARIYSADGSAQRGGDLDFFGPGQMVKPFEDAAYEASVGAVVGPVETQFGYHLIKVTDKKTEDGQEKVRASHILLKVETGPNTIDQLMSNARLFSYDAEDQGFAKALDAYQLKADTTKGGIDKTSIYFPGVGYAAELSRWAFTAKPGNISQIIETDNAIIVAQLLTITAPSIRPLDEVKAAIERELQRQEREKIAQELAQSLYASAKEGTALKSLQIDSLGVKLQQYEDFTIAAAPGAFRNNEPFAATLRELELNEISRPIKTSRDFSIIQLRMRGKFDETKFAAEKESKYEELLNQKQNQLISDWMQNTRDAAKIEDFRDRFF